MAVVGVDAQLVDDFEVVLAPVLDVDQGVVERCAVVALEGVDAAQRLRGVVDVRRDHVVKQALEFAFGELHAVKRLELLAEVGFQGGAVADVVAVGVFEIAQLRDQIKLDLVFRGCHCHDPIMRMGVLESAESISAQRDPPTSVAMGNSLVILWHIRMSALCSVSAV
jgi:hypothetical protein